ncbi:hypothetical protein F7725_000594 [Dissostichus mawsoni]|uniref:EPS8 spectrin-like domain-containing protein n=1 Tax=Dissostichus mawsoni TaxID=36200 RepID=A0A7J5ZH85_DISMA|nr:hypothetical protein F7725_000594 [Dissostichus mawsoni]
MSQGGKPGLVLCCERDPPPTPDHPPPQWRDREPVEDMPPPRSYTPQEPMMHHPDLHELQISPEPAEQTDTERSTDILNHIINDLEIFMGRVSAAVNASSLPQGEKSKKKKSSSKKKKSKKNGPAGRDPEQPTAPDFVHIFFNSLSSILPEYPADLPLTVLSPLLTEVALRLLSEVVDPEEDRLWRSLGDCWNFPRSRFPNEDVQPYIPEFYDGWQPSPLSRRPSPLPPMSRSNSQRFPPTPPVSPLCT